jgi:hypothetical protein
MIRLICPTLWSGWLVHPMIMLIGLVSWSGWLALIGPVLWLGWLVLPYDWVDWSILLVLSDDGFDCTSRSRIFHLYGDVTIVGEGLQNLGLCSALRAFEQGGIFIVPHLLWQGTSVFPVSAPFSYLLRHTRGCGGSILARIFTGDDWSCLMMGLIGPFLWSVSIWHSLQHTQAQSLNSSRLTFTVMAHAIFILAWCTFSTLISIIVLVGFYTFKRNNKPDIAYWWKWLIDC